MPERILAPGGAGLGTEDAPPLGSQAEAGSFLRTL
jgi:hypothetical protein